MVRRISVLFALVSAIFIAAVLPAKAEDYSNVRIVRLSFVEGDVQYRHAGEEWQTAGINLPIQNGFGLQTGNGYAEVEFENGLAVRLAKNTMLDFTELAMVDGHHVTRLTIARGTALVTANLSKLDELSVAGPQMNLDVPHSGKFRVDVSPAESWVTVFRGRVDFVSGGGNLSLAGHQTAHMESASNLGAPQIVRSPAPDAFDKWVSEREDATIAAQNETSDYLMNKYYRTGFADLYNYGYWTDVPGYGFGWQPYGVGMGWMPFTNGMWSFMPNTGWNWMSAEPWGWLPYHFGGWVDVLNMGWMWIPSYGDMMWQPANASWVTVNNVSGWIPNAPVLAPAKSTKVLAPSAPPVVILTGKVGFGTIGVGPRAPIVSGTRIMPGTAPKPVFTAQSGVTGQGVSVGTVSASGTAPTQGTPGLQGRTANGPKGVGAPTTGITATRQGPANFGPPTMQAPKSMPAPPASLHGTGSGGFGGGFNAGEGGHGVGSSFGAGGGGGGMPPSHGSSGTTSGASTGGTTGTSGSGTSGGSSGGSSGGGKGGGH